MPELTPDEAKFFETGELPESLKEQVDSDPVVETAVPVPKIDAPVQQQEVNPLQEALLAEQRRTAAAEARLAELERQFAEKTATPKVEAPNPDLDPLGNMMHQLRQVNETVANLQNQLTQEQQNNLLKQQFEQFTNSVRAIKEQFEKTTPDFNDAYNHIRNIRTEDLSALGVSKPEIDKILLQDELNLAQAAVTRGKNPAEELYNMAKRYGYSAKTQPNPTTSAAKIANIAKGTEASKTAQRSSPESELTIDSLKDASNSDLNKMVQDDKLWAKLVGGTSNDIF